jgi:hypothetical protein
VSGYPPPGNDDDWWEIVCTGGEAYWTREAPVGVRHVQTQKWLSADVQHMFGHPIRGHLEVACVDANENSLKEHVLWSAQDGVYFAN